jgi:hypothetical protein
VELRGSKNFSNEIDGHECQELILESRSAGWVSAPVKTDIGVIARVCEEEQQPYEGAAVPGSVHGGVASGWFVFGPSPDARRTLSLPDLSDFSNPSFCGHWASYWVPSEENGHLIVADLRSGAVIKSVAVGPLLLETDYMYHLAPATWSPNCCSVTFDDPRYIVKTDLEVGNGR